MSATPFSIQATAQRAHAKNSPNASSWRREPLLHFLLLGALLYVASRLWAPGAADAQIVIDTARVERLVRLYELQTGAAPNAAQRERLIQDFVRDEALYRDALKLGLNEGDELVRRRMVQKMEFLNAGVEPAEPTEAQLRAYHRAHAAQFAATARLSFTQVYFSPDGRGSAAARDAAAIALASQLALGADMPRGDRSPVATDYANMSRDEVQRTFGQRPLVEALMQAPLGQWVGPVESGYGWHLVRVSDRAEPVPLSLEQTRAAVIEAWQREARAEAERTRNEGLMRRYTVVRSDLNPTIR
jgi:hypothetical protein